VGELRRLSLRAVRLSSDDQVLLLEPLHATGASPLRSLLSILSVPDLPQNQLPWLASAALWTLAILLIAANLYLVWNYVITSA
jgi:hypothetical protein